MIGSKIISNWVECYSAFIGLLRQPKAKIVINLLVLIASKYYFLVAKSLKLAFYLLSRFIALGKFHKNYLLVNCGISDKSLRFTEKAIGFVELVGFSRKSKIKELTSM